MPETFVLRALLAGLMLAIVAAPFGCVVVWRRMAYFGETIAQAGFVGVALAVMLSIDPTIGILIMTIATALALVAVGRHSRIPLDSVLGIAAHALLALGIVALSLTESRLDLRGLLFGDLLSVSTSDLVWMALSAAIGLGAIFAIWSPLVSLSVNADLATAEGVDVAWVRLVFVVALAIVVAIAMKIVGALLTIAFLIIPAAAARPLSSTPERMVLGAACIGALGVLGGLALSFRIDTPAGASIVVVLAVLFLATTLFRQLVAQR